jgi:hypothetical protein
MSGTEPQIVVAHGTGRMANRMFQLMLGQELHRRAGCGRLVGYALPRWSIVGPPPGPLLEPVLVLRGHVFDLDEVAYLLRTGALRTVVLEGWGMRLPNFGPPERYRPLFPVSAEGYRAAADELVIHVRTGDIVNLHHYLYCPLPFSFYERVIAESGLRPVFMGEIGGDGYSLALRQRFAGARFLAPQSVDADFNTIRAARHVALSVSSYAWMAAWLSETLETIRYPVFRMLDPRNGETFLTPLDDPRYIYYELTGPPERAREGDLLAWAGQAATPPPLSRAELVALAFAAAQATRRVWPPSWPQTA